MASPRIAESFRAFGGWQRRGAARVALDPNLPELVSDPCARWNLVDDGDHVTATTRSPSPPAGTENCWC